MADRHQDSFGHKPQYTWFYRYDYPNEKCVRTLSDYVYQDYGEIEFHLHHGNDTESTFRDKIHSGVEWFNRFGAMIGAVKNPSPGFAYIAGNWALDNGCFDDSVSGVNTELGILASESCYADFTFPAMASKAQPDKVNAIYYATCSPQAKSYNTGTNVKVNRQQNGDLMIFQGPLYIKWNDAYIDYAAVESGTPYYSGRFRNWINAGIHVEDKPEWVFIKLHTHGIQNYSTVLSPEYDLFLQEIEEYSKQNNLRLHYVTSREAYNIVKAAEAGEEESPDNYRDYIIPPPVNRFVKSNIAYKLTEYSAESVRILIPDPSIDVQLEFNNLPVKKIAGEYIKQILIDRKNENIFVHGDKGEHEIHLNRGDIIKNNNIPHTGGTDGA